MPVAIACPKCQSRYSLPENALGKPVKCKSCGTVFKTKSPAQQAPGKPNAPQPTAQAGQPAAKASRSPSASPELAKFGIDGPIGRPADIFAGTSAPPPQMGNPLGNFVLDDPGFADLSIVQEEVEQEKADDDGMSSILKNPYMSAAKSKARGQQKASSVDVSGYAVARVGMWMVYIAWGLMLGITVFFTVFAAIGRLVPQDTLRSIAETLGPTFGQVLLWIMFVFFWVWVLSVGVIFVGQILCIFAPNKNEKLFAGLTVGSIVGAFALFFVTLLMGAFAGVIGRDAEAAQAAVGVLILLTVLGIYGLLLASMFFYMTYFKKIGQNIKARKVVEAAKTAMYTWTAAIVFGIISSILSFILLAVYAGEDQTFLLQVIDILGLVNVLLFIAVMGTLLVMVRSALDRTKPA